MSTIVVLASDDVDLCEWFVVVLVEVDDFEIVDLVIDFDCVCDVFIVVDVDVLVLDVALIGGWMSEIVW